MKAQPVKGTKDFLPQEESIRTKMREIIEKTYTSFGFNKISTPIIEDIENLNNSDGGDNLKLIFKILKRGDKLEKALNISDFNHLADLGLRYDLTLPLARFYSQNAENLPKPFKSIQIDRVYRAERPQNGRMREFYQCDIDILGSESLLCEVELIYVTMKALENLGLTNLTVKINSRKLLKELLLSFGYHENEIDEVCICFDKLDKIGKQNVLEELNDKINNKEANNKFGEFLSNKQDFDYSILESKSDVDFVMQKVEEISGGKIKTEFDISLVRGQSYYTGCVFEIYSKELGFAVGGGGRYDEMIKKFCGNGVPAVGFSIGFERIYALLLDSKTNFDLKPKIAILFEKENFYERFKILENFQKKYDCCLFQNPKKLSKLLEKLERLGYIGFVGTNNDSIKFFENHQNN